MLNSIQKPVITIKNQPMLKQNNVNLSNSIKQSGIQSDTCSFSGMPLNKTDAFRVLSELIDITEQMPNSTIKACLRILSSDRVVGTGMCKATLSDAHRINKTGATPLTRIKEDDKPLVDTARQVVEAFADIFGSKPGRLESLKEAHRRIKKNLRSKRDFQIMYDQLNEFLESNSIPTLISKYGDCLNERNIGRQIF